MQCILLNYQQIEALFRTKIRTINASVLEFTTLTLVYLADI